MFYTSRNNRIKCINYFKHCNQYTIQYVPPDDVYSISWWTVLFLNYYYFLFLFLFSFLLNGLEFPALFCVVLLNNFVLIFFVEKFWLLLFGMEYPLDILSFFPFLNSPFPPPKKKKKKEKKKEEKKRKKRRKKKKRTRKEDLQI